MSTHRKPNNNNSIIFHVSSNKNGVRSYCLCVFYWIADNKVEKTQKTLRWSDRFGVRVRFFFSLCVVVQWKCFNRIEILLNQLITQSLRRSCWFFIHFHEYSFVFYTLTSFGFEPINITKHRAHSSNGLIDLLMKFMRILIIVKRMDWISHPPNEFPSQRQLTQIWTDFRRNFRFVLTQRTILKVN